MKEKRHLPYHIKRRIVIAIAILILAVLYFFRNLSDIIITASAISMIVLFYLIDHLFDVRFKVRHYVFVTIISIAGFLLGELYTIYPIYDKVLHFFIPLLFTSIVFHMTSNLNLKRKWQILFALFIVIGGVGLFEIAEYSLDYFFNLDLQGVAIRKVQEFSVFLEVVQEPLDDTMIDMVFGVLGAIVYSLFIAFFARKRNLP